MLKRFVLAATGVCLAAASFTVAAGQVEKAAEYTPPAGVEMQIHLYPISKFRGTPVILTESTARLRRPLAAESVLVTRGVWELCANIDFRPPCVTVNETRVGIPVAVLTRSARLVADTGPLFAEKPVARPGPDVPIAPSGEIVETRPAPAPVVAPTVEMGGAPGANPSLAGDAVEFFPEPARDGLRILACAQGRTTPRCVQATADTFCAERGYRDSSTREVKSLNGKDYLSNVLCKRAADAGSARRGLGIPFFGN